MPLAARTQFRTIQRGQSCMYWSIAGFSFGTAILRGVWKHPQTGLISGTMVTLLRQEPAETLIVAKQEPLVFLKGPSQRAAELVPAERGNRSLIKKLRASRSLLRRNSNSEPCN